MNNVLLTSMVALGIGLGTASFAQDTTKPEAPETEAAAAPAADASAEAAPEAANKEDEAFPVADDGETKKAPVGAELVKETHGDWRIVCVVVPEDQPEQCRLYQLLTDNEDNPVAEYSIVALEAAAKAAAGVNFVSPLGTLLTAQASMRIDSGKVARYPFGWCDSQGCIARYGLTNAELDNMKRGNKAVMTIVAAAAPKNPIELNLSLTGFTAAWNALKGE